MTERPEHFISMKRLTTTEELKVLREFAAEFAHSISSGDLSGVILRFYCDGQLFGYINIVKGIIAFPAFHPEKSTPGMMKKAADKLIDWAQTEAAISGSDIVGFIARSDDSPFTDEIMKKLGLVDTGMRLFSIRKE